MAAQHFEVSLKRSGAGRHKSQRATLEALGLKRFGRVIYVNDTPAMRGMLYSVAHLVQVSRHDGAAPARRV